MKNSKTQMKFKKKGFPIGIFFIILFIELILVAGTASSYFYFVGRERIAEIEKYTKNYSTTMAEAFAKLAELGYVKRQYPKLRAVFRQRKADQTIDEAFFVLMDGTLIAHSDIKRERALKGNMSNDEFRYNLDYILMPAKKISRMVYFKDYNIIDKKNPFNRIEQNYIKRFYYKDIDKLGWLVSKTVFYYNKPVGTVNFIISRERIFTFIQKHKETTIEIVKYASIGALVLSFLLSLIIFIRYRSIQNNTLEMTNACVDTSGPSDELSIEDLQIDDSPAEARVRDSLSHSQSHASEEPVPMNHIHEEAVKRNLVQPITHDDEFITIELLGTIDDEVSFAHIDEGKEEKEMDIFRDSVTDEKREIKDAIPIKKG